MAGLSTGLKKLLTISPCAIDDAGNISVDSSKDSFEVMLNPSSYSHGFTVKSSKNDALGKSAGETKFNTVRPETMGFDLWIDGTGVVNLPIPGIGSPDVKTQIQQLRDVVYTYDGENHSPNHVRLLWGSLIFFGTLESLSVEFTLFKPSGEPLRAKVALSFSGYQSKETVISEGTMGSMKRGIAKINSPLVVWCRSVLEADFVDPIVPSLMTVFLLNEHQIPIRAWSFANAYPVNWEVEDFNSTKNDVAIEKIDLCYNYSNRLI